VKSIIVLLAAITLASCSKVPAGYVGVKVHLLGSSKGVDSEVLDVGRYWLGANEELYLFPVFQQNKTWIKYTQDGYESRYGQFTFQSKEGLEASANIGITYSLKREKVHEVFQKYRKGIEEITEVFIRNHVRDALQQVSSTREIESLFGIGKNEFIKSVNEIVKKSVSKDGLDIHKVYLVGSIKLPESVTKSLNAKIEATQRAQQRENELREAQAEAQKKIAEAKGKAESDIEKARGEAEAILLRAKATAEANRTINKSLTEDLIEYEKIKVWDGKLPQVTGSNSALMLNLRGS